MPLSNHSSSASSCSFSSDLLTPASSMYSTSPQELMLKEQHWSLLNKQLRDLVNSLLKEKRDSESLINAWSSRSQDLERQVKRLSMMVVSLETKLEYKNQELSAMQSIKSLNMEDDDDVVRKEAGVYTMEEDFIKTRPVSKQKWIGDWRLSSPAVADKVVIPKIDPTKSMSKQSPPPCNSYYLIGTCNVPKCRFSHLYQLTPDQIEEMRRGARFHPCNSLKNGLECTDPTCCYGHTCPRGTACGRVNCAFTDSQHVGPPLKTSLTMQNKRLGL